MSYDIYGNNLRPGHCEVHPHIHEGYPCSQCVMEREQEQHRQDVNEQQRAAYEQQQREHWLTELAHEAENIFGEIVGDEDHDIIAWREKYRMVLPLSKENT